jgi:hypothetical protein
MCAFSPLMETKQTICVMADDKTGGDGRETRKGEAKGEGVVAITHAQPFSRASRAIVFFFYLKIIFFLHVNFFF